MTARYIHLMAKLLRLIAAWTLLETVARLVYDASWWRVAIGLGCTALAAGFSLLAERWGREPRNRDESGTVGGDP